MLLILRRVLDALYKTSGYIGATCLAVILLIIVAQMVTRWTGGTFPGATNYAGYFMAAASFLMLAHALNEGAHIRVSLVLSKLPPRGRRIGEIWCYSVATVTAIFFARYAVKSNYVSWRFGDVSQGLDATPVWIPQLAMSYGSILLAISLLDHLVRILFSRHMGVDSDKLNMGEA